MWPYVLDLRNIRLTAVKVVVSSVYFCFICHIYPPFTRKRIVSLYFGR